MIHQLYRNADLEIGKTYANKGGGTFRCLRYEGNNSYKMVNVLSGWTFYAHNITMYSNGSIEWDYSTGGYFA